MAKRAHVERRKNLVGFEVGGVSYAIDILRVREIIRPLPKLDIPSRGGVGLVGVSDHRGHVIPVVDLRARFGIGARGRERDIRWLIVKMQSHFIGLVVDRVMEVFGSSEPAGRDVSHLAKAGDVALIQAAYRHRGGLVFVLDVDRLIASAEIEIGDAAALDARPLDARPLDAQAKDATVEGTDVA